MNFTAVPMLLFSLVNPLDPLFGWITRVFYQFFGNYGLAIIGLTIVIRGLLIPLNVHSQKAMIKQQALSSQQAEIKRKYPNDKKKQQEEVAKLLSQNGAQSFSGCILPFVQLIFIYPIFSVVRGPLRFLAEIDGTQIKALALSLYDNGNGVISKAVMKDAYSNNIPILQAIQSNAGALQESVSKGLIKMGQIVDMNFLGLDLSRTPKFMPEDLFGAGKTENLFLLIIPVLVLLTTIVQMRSANVLKPNYKADKDAKERARLNPARSDQVPENSMENTMKFMNYVMPIVMLGTTFSFPAAMGFYWIIGNLMGILQQFIIYYLFSKPLQEKREEMAQLKALAFSKNAMVTEGPDLALTSSSNAGNKNGSSYSGKNSGNRNKR